MLQKTACFLVIGNEILSGRTQDANTRVLALALNAQGIRLSEVRVIPDIAERIINTVRECSTAYDIVFTSGGIGPTHDDITAECVAEATGVKLVRHEDTYQKLEAYLGKERFNTARQRMAYLPEGATPILNTASIAPGFSIGNVHVMAGVPSIFASMVEWLVPQMDRGAPLVSASWYAAGLKEGDFAADLATLQTSFPTIDLGSYPYLLDDGVKGVALVAKGYDDALVHKAAEGLHDIIMAQGHEPLAGQPPHKA